MNSSTRRSQASLANLVGLQSTSTNGPSPSSAPAPISAPDRNSTKQPGSEGELRHGFGSSVNINSNSTNSAIEAIVNDSFFYWTEVCVVLGAIAGLTGL